MIGIKERIAHKDILGSYHYFGQYGGIEKISINNRTYKTKGDPNRYFSAYVTYKNYVSACIAILALQTQVSLINPKLRASYATTKYCKFYIKGKLCRASTCNFYHVGANEDDI